MYQQHPQQSQGCPEHPGCYAPGTHHGQGPPAADPFLAPPGPQNTPPRRNRKKRTTSMQPAVPQPETATSKAVTTYPLEYRIAVLNSLGIHLRDPTSAAAYLETSSDTIPWPTPSELEDWTRITSIDDIQSRVMKNQSEIRKMSEILRGLLETMQQGDAPPTNAAPEPTVPAGDYEDTELPPEDELASSNESRQKV